MKEEALKQSFRRVNEKYLESGLKEEEYSLKWKNLSGQYGRVSHAKNHATITIHEKLAQDAQLTDYVMLHELLHTVKGFRWVRRHRGKFNQRMRELLGASEYRRLEARLRGVDIRKRVFKKRYVYECPTCRQKITRKRRIKNCSCATCDSKYNPSHKLRLIEAYSW
ncbi:MAG: hypothetical protein ABH834_05875 [Candidatus Altiarchaeota archaeon]